MAGNLFMDKFRDRVVRDRFVYRCVDEERYTDESLGIDLVIAWNGGGVC